MALPIITPTNFTGWVKIVAGDFKGAVLQEYIDVFLEQYVRQIIGDAAFLAIQNQPRQKWTDLFGGVSYVDVNDIARKYDGLTVSLLRFIYFEFIRDNFTSTQVGKVTPNNENSITAAAQVVSTVAVSRYNSGVNILNNSLPDFLEAFEELSTPVISFVDNADDTYLINVASTKYVEDTDMVTINDVEYVVSSVTANTSFVIDGSSIGLTFSGNVTWKPYELVEFCPMSIIGI